MDFLSWTEVAKVAVLLIVGGLSVNVALDDITGGAAARKAAKAEKATRGPRGVV